MGKVDENKKKCSAENETESASSSRSSVLFQNASLFFL